MIELLCLTLYLTGPGGRISWLLILKVTLVLFRGAGELFVCFESGNPK